MALPALAELHELEDWLGVSITDARDAARAGAILAAASTLVRTHTGRMWVGVDEEGAAVPEEGIDETKLAAVRQVVVQVADRVYNNPRGATQETAGPFSRSVAAWAAQGMSLTDDEKAMIGASTGGIPGLSSIRVVAPAAAAASRRDQWWWLDDEEELLL
jgi:hypothetical protein